MNERIFDSWTRKTFEVGQRVNGVNIISTTGIIVEIRSNCKWPIFIKDEETGKINCFLFSEVTETMGDI